MAIGEVFVGSALLASVLSPASGLFSTTKPWLKIEAGSEQRSPVYVGASPREIELLGRIAEKPVLPAHLEHQAHMLSHSIRVALMQKSKDLIGDNVDFEAWPAQDDQGQIVWAFARWRRNAQENWKWLDKALLGTPETRQTGDGHEVTNVLIAETLNPKADEVRLFQDFLFQETLYTKPSFGECVWTNAQGDKAYAAWMPLFEQGLQATISATRKNFEDKICHLVPQIARFNQKPMSFVIKVRRRGTTVSPAVEWREPLRAPLEIRGIEREDVEVIAGEKRAVFPISGRELRFERKNSAESDHQLGDLVSYLSERYTELGLRTVRHDFSWRGIPQANLVAIVPGSERGARNKPVLLADHIDTAFSEDEYEKTGRRVSAPGADDNAVATASLLWAARVLKDSRPKHDIWLVHFTGEEYPADCLGARHFVSNVLLHGKKDIKGLVLMDMIGYRASKEDPVFQIHPGASQASLELARLALSVAPTAAPSLKPVIQTRFDFKSYLYNTDGVIFSDVGYPVILLNEHINKLENFNRPHYHQTSDSTATIDWDYAAAIARVAVETAANLAGVKK